MPIKAQQGSEVCSLKEAKSFAFIELGEGMEMRAVKFRDTFANELFDYFVTTDKHDDLDEVFELGARVLLARPGMSIDDVVEGMMFRELDEIV